MFISVPEPLAPINKDESLKLECVVEATPKPVVSWYVFSLLSSVCFRMSIISIYDTRLVNGKELNNKDGVQIEKDVNNNKYSLTIPKANPSVHAGTLAIKASNLIGSVQHDLNLTILGLSLTNYNNLDIQLIKIVFLKKIHLNLLVNWKM